MAGHCEIRQRPVLIECGYKMRYSEGISEYFAQERIGKYLGEGGTRMFRNDAFLYFFLEKCLEVGK